MIFVTVGSQKFQFNRLLKEIDEMVQKGVITEPVFAQIGYSDYRPSHYEYKDFLDREEFAEWESKCDILITHGGTGAIIGAVKKGKKVIAVPRLAKYGEHVDDHQIQIIDQFSKLGLIFPCLEIDNMEEALKTAKNTKYKQYESNTSSIIRSIEKFIEENIVL